MTTLAFTNPEVGSRNTIAEPRVDVALEEIKKWANGEVGTNNIAAGVVTETMLSSAVKTLLNEKTAGGTTKKSIITTTEERTNTAFGTLTTPDEVELEMPANGLIAIWYQAVWKESAQSQARASIFLNGTQVKIGGQGFALPEEALMGGTVGKYSALFSCPWGLASHNASGVQDSTTVTTGMVVGGPSSANAKYVLNEQTVEVATGLIGGPLYVFAEAGVYKVSVRFKAISGTVTAKTRKLWALAIS